MGLDMSPPKIKGMGSVLGPIGLDQTQPITIPTHNVCY